MMYEDYTVKNVRTMNESIEDKKVSEDFRGSSEMFNAVYRKIGARNNFRLVAKEFSKVMKRFQDDMTAYNSDIIPNPPSFSMDEITTILSAYAQQCRQNGVHNHHIGITKEVISIEITSKAGDFYPEMRKAKVTNGTLLLPGEVLATVIMKVFDPRFKTTRDFEEILSEEGRFKMSYLNVLKAIHGSTFKDDYGEKLKESIEIDVVRMLHGKRYYFELRDGGLRFICSVNDFLPVLITYLSRTPNLSLILISASKKQMSESLERNLRLFMDEIDKTKILIRKRKLNEQEELEELPLDHS